MDVNISLAVMGIMASVFILIYVCDPLPISNSILLVCLSNFIFMIPVLESCAFSHVHIVNVYCNR